MGLLDAIFQEQDIRVFGVSDSQKTVAGWVAMTVMCCVAEVVLYWVLWPCWTLVFDRELYVFWCVVFAVVDGVANGLIMEIVWFLLQVRCKLPGWASWILTWCAVGAWQGLFGSYYWNVYVLPEHDTPETLKLKTFACHIPNLSLTLTHLVLYENKLLFILFQTFALLSCSLKLRFPSPFSKEFIDAARCEAGMCGLPVAVGFVEEEEFMEESLIQS